MFQDENPGLLFASFMILLGYAVSAWFVAGEILKVVG